MKINSSLKDDEDDDDDIEAGIKVIKDSKSDDENNMKKVKHGFRIGMPDFNLPSFGFKGNSKIGKNLEVDEPGYKMHYDKKTEVSEPHLSGEVGADLKTEKLKLSEESSEDIKIAKPDINIPFLNIKGKEKPNKERTSSSSSSSDDDCKKEKRTKKLDSSLSGSDESDEVEKNSDGAKVNDKTIVHLTSSDSDSDKKSKKENGIKQCSVIHIRLS